MKIFIKTSDICQESNLMKGPTNYILLVRDDHLDSSCITFRQNTFRQFIETPLLGKQLTHVRHYLRLTGLGIALHLISRLTAIRNGAARAFMY